MDARCALCILYDNQLAIIDSIILPPSVRAIRVVSALGCQWVILAVSVTCGRCRLGPAVECLAQLAGDGLSRFGEVGIEVAAAVQEPALSTHQPGLVESGERAVDSVPVAVECRANPLVDVSGWLLTAL